MVSATGDWTKDTPNVEFPAVHHIYRLLGAEDMVSWVQIDAEHNYNKASREAVYSWFARWLPETPQSRPVEEKPFEVEQEADLRVFPDGKLPEGSLDADGVERLWIDASEAQIKAHRPSDKRSLERFDELYRPALARALALPEAFGLASETLSQETDVDISTRRLVIEERVRGARIPAVVIEATDSVPAKTVVVADGPGGSFVESGAVRKLVEQGWRVIGIDCFGIAQIAVHYIQTRVEFQRRGLPAD